MSRSRIRSFKTVVQAIVGAIVVILLAGVGADRLVYELLKPAGANIKTD